jgi:hypothetical protein
MSLAMSAASPSTEPTITDGAKPETAASAPVSLAEAMAASADPAPVATAPVPAAPPKAGSGLWSALPFAAAVALAAGLVGVGGMALRGSAPQAPARLAQLEQALATLAGEISALRAQTEVIAQQPKVAASLGPIVSRLDVLGEAIERMQKDQQTRIAALASGERGSDRALGEKLAALTGRLERIEKAVTTASVPASPAAVSPVQPLPPKPQEAGTAKLPGYILRDVDDGIAVIEDRRGAIHELMRGEMLPGVGRIQKIERRGNAWVAVTERGIISGR